ncbi:alpha/beta fold hydrolase [Chryseobacterium sp.]|uniref:alpha/beta fold hydrolase n=1 Tax=Chryseobacterium sp. TaxID=1871047 RepID=UPI0038906212
MPKKNSIAIFFFLLMTTFKAQNIYSKAYGNKDNTALIYLHGGPRGNSTLFEETTAKALAEKGYYVIVYDRLGEGRSADTAATLTYKESIKDLTKIYKKYDLQKAHLISHSFGGLVGTLFAQKKPYKVESLILVGGLFSQQDTYTHILESSKKIAAEKHDLKILHWINDVEQLPRNSAEYRKQCYEIASEN